MSAIINIHSGHTGLRVNGADGGMAALEAAVLVKDKYAFGAVSNALYWKDRQPEDFLHAVTLALTTGPILLRAS